MVKLILFIGIALWASVLDIRFRQNPPYLRVLLLLIGLMQFHLSAVWGYLVIFLPLYYVWSRKGGLGGGDVKYAAACAFVLQGLNGLIGILAGLLLALLLVPTFRLLRRKPLNTPFPLIPFLSAGCIAAGILLL